MTPSASEVLMQFWGYLFMYTYKNNSYKKSNPENNYKEIYCKIICWHISSPTIY